MTTVRELSMAADQSSSLPADGAIVVCLRACLSEVPHHAPAVARIVHGPRKHANTRHTTTIARGVRGELGRQQQH